MPRRQMRADWTDMLVLAARIALFLASQAGWLLLARRRLRVGTGLAPVVAVSAQVSILFVAGILNLLVPAGIALFAAGVASLAWGIMREREETRGTLASLPVIWLAVAAVVLMLLVRGREIVAYDNFSHWATMVSSMVRTGRYPNFMDPMIEFQSYPPGSATWAWYASLAVGTSEATWMFAQGLVELACMVPLLCLSTDADGLRGSRPSPVLPVAAVSLAAVALMTCNVSPFGLMVDTLMPLLAGAAAVTAMGIPAEGGADARRNMVALGLVLAFLVLVKSAAALFAVAALVVAAMRVRPRRGVLVAAAFPVVATVLWSAHCSYVFPAAETSKHAVSATGWMETLSGKSPGDLTAIVSSMAGFAVSPLSLAVPLAGLVLAFVLAAAVDRHAVTRGEDAGLDSPRPRLSDPARAVVFAVAFYVIYMLGLLAMYVFSMPLGEALALAGADRYRRTAVAFCAYILFAMLVRRAGRAAWWDAMLVGATAASAAVCVASLVGAGPMPQLLDNRRGSDARDRWEAVLSPGAVPEGSRVVACLPADEDDASGYNSYLVRYLTWCPDVRVVRGASPEDLERLAADGYEWVVSRDTGNDALAGWLGQQEEQESEQEGAIARLPREERDG